MQEFIENIPAEIAEKEQETEEQPKKENPQEPEVLIKREKYTLLHMARNVVVFMVIFAVLYFCSPIEFVSISSSSMQPTLPVGSVSIAVKADKDTEYMVGDIITFSVEYEGTYYSRITHRIVAIDGNTIQTKGDNNPEVDPFTINKSQIRNIVKWTNIFKI